MPNATNLVEVLQQRAAVHGQRPAYTFLADGEGELVSWTYAELERRARACAIFLAAAGAANGRVLLLLPPGLDFVAAFFGCSFAGAVAVPAYPPQSRRMLPRVRAILEDCRPAVVLSTAAVIARVASRFREEWGDATPPWLAVEDIDPVQSDSWQDPGVAQHSLALLQYTSGSTTAPRGVMITQGNLLHNQQLIQRACGHDESSRFVSWLPVYHDLGLIGNVLQSAFVGAHCVLMAPVAFLQRPRRWLEAVSRYRATTSGGPDFAYDLCVRRVPPEERMGLDLGSWRIAFNGAEPVQARTLERFAQAFAAAGFRRQALVPCYGLAEATLMVSGGPHAAGPLIPTFDSRALERGLVIERTAPAADPAVRSLVGCGQPLSGQEVRIVDPDTRQPCPPGRQGEIWVRGESVGLGYWGHARDASPQVFGACLAVGGEGTYLRTGDLGFQFRGQLFVSGRLKDLIIVRGRNLYPQDIEAAIQESHPCLAGGQGAAFAVDDEAGERLVAVHEVEARQGCGSEEVMAAAHLAVSELYEIPLHELVLIRSGTLPRTSSGKV
ncbi:MAG TPA: fatty acyl-AMP ligase, partial [Thermoanaerobaculia bacterium]